MDNRQALEKYDTRMQQATAEMPASRSSSRKIVFAKKV
jgi:hypothetical protein